ncbi:MAG: M20/M25/M40 family metallo-hydrolase, partial [Sphingobacteriales bacterium]
SVVFRKIAEEILLNGTCYENLRVLCKSVGHRLSGSPAAARAVDWGYNALQAAGADRVWLQPVEVPHWVRGKESLQLRMNTKKGFETVPMLSLGNSVGTDGKVMEGSIVMVNDFAEFRALTDDKVRGMIVFFNHRFPQELTNPFEGYGAAGAYRWNGPNMAAARGAAAVIIRSVSTGLDDAPHTGSLRYADSVKPIPAIAIGNTIADKLETACRKGETKARIQSECKMLGTAQSFNVIGELKGSAYPDQIVLAGGHLDSWDVGEGAHDDGAGCVQSIEIIRTFKALGIRPKRTVRAVLFMNEENGLRGGFTYNDSAKANKEHHIFAIESDAGGFSPRGIGLDMERARRQYIQGFRNLFLPYGVYDFEHDEGGADITPLSRSGVPTAGLIPDPQRYFDHFLRSYQRAFCGGRVAEYYRHSSAIAGHAPR